MIYRRYTRCLLLSPLAFLVPVGFVNYFGDAAALFAKRIHYEKRIAESLLGGDNVEGISNLDERILQSLCLKSMKSPPLVFVLGSSRVMNISSRLFSGASMFNLGVSGCGLEDLLALGDLLDRRSFLTGRTIVIGVDPWVFNRFNEQNRWKSLAANAVHGAEKIDWKLDPPSTVNDSWKRLSQLISGKYFLRSINGVVRARERGFEIRKTSRDVGELPLRRRDGSIEYGRSFLSRNVKDVQQDAVAYTRDKPVYSLGNFSTIDPDLLSGFEKFLAFLKTKGASVRLVLFPYHPKTYSILSTSSKYKIIVQVEARLREMAALGGVPIVGSYDPGVAGCVESEYLDGMHLKEGCLKKILMGIRAERPGARDS